MAKIFNMRNDVPWIDSQGRRRTGVCAALTAEWIKATLAHGPLTSGFQLTGGKRTSQGLMDFFKRCAMAQARFRNELLYLEEIGRKLILYNRIGLPAPDGLAKDVFMTHFSYIKDNSGIYSLDLKWTNEPSFETDKWHTIGVFVDRDNDHYQVFEPEEGLFAFPKERALFIKRLMQCADWEQPEEEDLTVGDATTSLLIYNRH